MNILHYSLGFPPYRNGGMTIFFYDLCKFQQKNGDNVFVMWPGTMNSKKVDFKFKKYNEFTSIELINPLPIPLCNGILDIDKYIEKVDIDIYIKLLSQLKPDIIHIHTLMGIHYEFFEAAKKLKIKIIYTTHDYFGLCPTAHFFADGKKCENYGCCENCIRCNVNAYSINKIKLMQSKAYRILKNTKIVTFMRNKFRKNNELITNKENINIQNDYLKLKEYYLSIFNLINFIHCNSTVSYSVFSKFINTQKMFIANITNLQIKDNRRRMQTIGNNGKIRLLFLGPESDSKGFKLLINILDEIYLERNDFVLQVYSRDNYVERDYIEKKGSYSQNDLEYIFKNCDFFILPSLWDETFGFTVLEAFSYGIPSIVTSNVGAKDIIISGKTGIVCTENGVKQNIENLLNHPQMILNMNKEICNQAKFFSYQDMYEKIYNKIKL